MAASGRLQSVAFEVFGKVQGVFFRKHTQETALKKGVKGFVKNTPRGTVVGVLEGPAEAVESMKQWLSKEGSPSSRIDQCVFNNEKTLDAFTYSEFSIVRRKKT